MACRASANPHVLPDGLRSVPANVTVRARQWSGRCQKDGRGRPFVWMSCPVSWCCGDWHRSSRHGDCPSVEPGALCRLMEHSCPPEMDKPFKPPIAVLVQISTHTTVHRLLRSPAAFRWLRDLKNNASSSMLGFCGRSGPRSGRDEFGHQDAFHR